MNARELAAAIRKGHTMAPEGPETMPGFAQDCACALGAAWLGSGKTAAEYWSVTSDSREFYGKFADGLCISLEMALDISNKHTRGMPRLEIANWLDTLDVSKPKDAQSFNDFMKVVTQPVELEAA